jgi:cyclopropane-fatty-acyl-phospholipid synthase
MSSAGKERIAVIGSGISGLSAAWLLQKGGYSVTLYESEAYFGGHTLTDETILGCPVDLGFQVFNRTTYGHFEQFLESLGVDSEESDMNFALSVDGGKLEWGSHSLSTIFAQRGNLCSPSFWKMIYDVVRFGKEAPKVLTDETYNTMNLGQYLLLHKYSQSFTERYLLPMCAAIWSVSNKQCLEFPIQVLVRFWVNHHLLDLLVRPKWRVVKNRSRSYVTKVIDQLKDARCSTPVTLVKRTNSGVTVHDARGGQENFDQVVFATHSDVTMKILGTDLDKDEMEMLKGVPYAENDVYLHRDKSLMPKERSVWSAWNVLQASGAKGASADERPVCVSYFINALQRLPEGSGDIFVTLNPPMEPAPDKTIRKLKLSHPVFSFASLATQEKVRATNGRRRTWFCGAWCGYGFHEDGIKAAVAVVEKLGVTLPWKPRPTSPYTSWSEGLCVATVDRLLRAALSTGSVRIIMPNGSERVYGTFPDVAMCKSAGGTACHTRVRVFDLHMFARILKDTDIGLGESYMAGEFEPDDLTGFLNVLTQNVNSINASQRQLGLLNWIGTKAQSMAHYARANTIEGSRRNIAEHYDLGNDMYKLFLDESWMYSCAFFKSESDTLYQAQLNKLDLIIDKLELKHSDHILEIGCGWGGFAVRAAERSGCRVTGVTISEEQFAYATERVARAGLEKKVTILMCDYRKMEQMAGQFDKLVSIEMIEAVGHENLGEYFAIIERMLKPGGKAVIQAITYKDEHYESYCRYE